MGLWQSPATTAESVQPVNAAVWAGTSQTCLMASALAATASAPLHGVLACAVHRELEPRAPLVGHAHHAVLGRAQAKPILIHPAASPVAAHLRRLIWRALFHACFNLASHWDRTPKSRLPALTAYV